MTARPAEAVRPLLPDSVVVIECPADEALLHAMPPEEQAVVAKAVTKRRAEFAGGRTAARAALRALGVPDAPLLPGPDRAPIWPDGIVGTISHSAGRTLAAVARATDLAGVGIDLEPDRPIEEDLWRSILTGGERAALAGVEDPGRRVRLVFTAKEAFYKCVGPTIRRFIGFSAAEVDVDEGGGRFVVRTAEPDLARTYPGRFVRDGGHVISVVVTTGESAG